MIFKCVMTKKQYLLIKANDDEDVANWLYTHTIDDVRPLVSEIEYGEEIVGECDEDEEEMYDEVDVDLT